MKRKNGEVRKTWWDDFQGFQGSVVTAFVLTCILFAIIAVVWFIITQIIPALIAIDWSTPEARLGIAFVAVFIGILALFRLLPSDEEDGHDR